MNLLPWDCLHYAAPLAELPALLGKAPSSAALVALPLTDPATLYRRCRAGAPAHLADLMARVDGAKQRSIIQHMSKDLIPIMEKGLVDCPLVHRCVAAQRWLCRNLSVWLCGNLYLTCAWSHHG